MKNKFLAFIALIAVGGMLLTGCGKKGCTDSNALNFDPDAKKDDGSCQFETAKPQVVIKDDGTGTGTVTWTADNEYLLDGFVFVNSGDVLTIEAGTVIKGKPGQGANASALIVAKGGKIMANGTAAKPIIFTAEQDDLSDARDIPFNSNGTGLWGGVIILGNASLNSNPGTTQIEGIPTTEPRGIYGGTDDNDNSGVFRYVSIRHGGTDIGAGNEINGFTLGGVGDGTTIDHIEVLFNADDGVEFFGGTVNTKHMAVAFCEDDSYDYDEGFRGRGQFWFTIQGANAGDRGGEHDGGTNPEAGMPYATPNVWNATYIGSGEAAGKRTLTLRDNAGGMYNNSIFTEFGKGVDIENLASGEDSYARFVAGDLKLSNNIFWNVAGNTANDIFAVSVGSGVDAADSTASSDAIKQSFGDNNNQVLDPSFTISRDQNSGLNPNPGNTAVLSGAPAPSDSWYDNVTYYGAFDGTNNWLSGWSGLATLGFMAQ